MCVNINKNDYKCGMGCSIIVFAADYSEELKLSVLDDHDNLVIQRVSVGIERERA